LWLPELNSIEGRGEGLLYILRPCSFIMPLILIFFPVGRRDLVPSIVKTMPFLPFNHSAHSRITLPASNLSTLGLWVIKNTEPRNDYRKRHILLAEYNVYSL